MCFVSVVCRKIKSNMFLCRVLKRPPHAQINKACSESVNFHFIRRLRVITSLSLSEPVEDEQFEN